MAVSEKGGKDSSGEYVYRIEHGSVVTAEDGNPLILQDCVKYKPSDPDCIAELFVAWAKLQKLDFWAD